MNVIKAKQEASPKGPRPKTTIIPPTGGDVREAIFAIRHKIKRPRPKRKRFSHTLKTLLIVKDYMERVIYPYPSEYVMANIRAAIRNES